MYAILKHFDWLKIWASNQIASKISIAEILLKMSF